MSRGAHPRAALQDAGGHVRGVVGAVQLLAFGGGDFGHAVGEDDLQAEHTTTALRGRGGRADYGVACSAVPRDATSVYVPQVFGERLNGPVVLEASPVVEDGAIGRELRLRAFRILPAHRGYPVACRVLRPRTRRGRSACGHALVGGGGVGGCVAEEVVAVRETRLAGKLYRIVVVAVAEVAPDGEAGAVVDGGRGCSGRRCEGGQDGPSASEKHRYPHRSRQKERLSQPNTPSPSLSGAGNEGVGPPLLA